MKLIWKLLKKPISLSQIIGFILANIIGTTIILLSIQFYRDISPVLKGTDSFMSQNYIVATKKISTLSSLSGKSNLFSSKEIAELKKQDFCKSLGVFTPSQFKVYAGLSIESKGIRFGTDMFFESVPNHFIDVSLEEWQFNPTDENKIIPIILPRNYLNLYNFGFAESRNLPKLSEGMIGMVQLDVNLSGKEEYEAFKGQIIGFSDRLNTILVPQTFMEWANGKFSVEQHKDPSRIIIEVDQPSDPAIADFFQQKGYEAESGALDESKTTYFLKMIFGVVLFIGLLISILSLYILLLSIFLLIQKSTEKLRNLQLIGYKATQLAIPYQLLVAVSNVVVVFLSLGIVYFIRSLYITQLQPLLPNLKTEFSLTLCIIAFILLLLIVVMNSLLIKQRIKRI